MPTHIEVREVLNAAMASQSNSTETIRTIRREFRTPAEAIEDTTEALRYCVETDADAVEQPRWRIAISEVVRAFEGLTTQQQTDFRDAVRAKMVDATSPQWLMDSCQKIKRRYINDCEETDPIEIEAAAALVVIADADNRTEEELAEANQTLAKWKDLCDESQTS